MKITVDRSRCSLIGMCEAVAPDLFEVRESGVHVLDPAPSPSRLGEVEEAVSACPTGALRLEL